MQKHNKALRIASVLLVLVLISTVAFTGTLAKYATSATSASYKVRVGAFRVIATIGDDVYDLVADADDLKDGFYLPFGDIKEADTTTPEDDYAIISTKKPSSLAELEDKPWIVFPGSGNTLKDIKIENKSEVPVVLQITADSSATVLDNIEGLEFRYGTTWYSTFSDFLNAVNADLSTGAVLAPLTGFYEIKGIAIRWNYHSKDTEYDSEIITASKNQAGSDYFEDAVAADTTDTAAGTAAAAWAYGESNDLDSISFSIPANLLKIQVIQVD
ncbi:MAG: hypothetical protein LBR73_07635 [Oscillospiraceae bacterium]|jgi:hypothetical protein|nr:hypothetical protein [Oscillospiraceae bacterium]